MNNANDPNLLNYLKKFGSFTIAYSAVFDDEMTNYYLEDIGYILYAQHKNIRFMLGDPLCKTEDIDTLVKAFLDDCSKNNNIFVGLQSSYEVAKVFSKYGFSANHFGVETILYLDSFNTKGKSKSKVRRWLNSASKAGLEVKEFDPKDPILKNEIDRITDEWLQNKANQSELKLLTRPYREEYEPGVRFFCGLINDKIVAVNTFEPMYENEKVIGYYANICRIDDKAPNGSLDLIQEKARQSFKEEGCKYFSFGLSPLSEIDDKEKIHNPIVTMLLNTNYKYGNSLYSFQGLDFHKKSYHDGESSERTATYLITRGTLPINVLINTLSYIGILPNKNFISSLSYLGETIVKGFYENNKNKFKITEGEFKNILPKLLAGSTNIEIANNYKVNSTMVEEFSNYFTSIGKKKLPEYQENMHIQRKLDDDSKKIYSIIERIVDEDPDVYFVYNINVFTSLGGYFAMMTIEVNGKITVNKANFIIARIKSKINEKCPGVHGTSIEIEPIGQYAYKLGLKNISEKEIVL